MKKLKLDLDRLDVTSFTAEKQSGSVHSMAITANTCQTGSGCYPSMYCSGPGCVNTYYDGCMTDNVYAC
jgi:hypothetical protein